VIDLDGVSAQALSDTIGAIYDCALDPQQWPDTCRKFADLCESTAGGICVHDLRHTQTTSCSCLGTSRNSWKSWDRTTRKVRWQHRMSHLLQDRNGPADRPRSAVAEFDTADSSPIAAFHSFLSRLTRHRWLGRRAGEAQPEAGAEISTLIIGSDDAAAASQMSIIAHRQSWPTASQF
jgi:hypothetical protein